MATRAIAAINDTKNGVEFFKENPDALTFVRDMVRAQQEDDTWTAAEAATWVQRISGTDVEDGDGSGSPDTD